MPPDDEDNNSESPTTTKKKKDDDDDDDDAMTMTDKELMLAGRLYQAFSKELLQERIAVKELCFELNQTRPSDQETRRSLIHKIIGRSDAIIESPFHCDYGYNLKVGKNFYANHGCTILDCNVITIGDNVMLGPHVVISAASHPLSIALRVGKGDELTKPIVIGNNVWIGASATILPGVTLGHGVVVGAGAVVTRDIPENAICAGVPAKVLRIIDQKAMEDEERNEFS